MSGTLNGTHPIPAPSLRELSRPTGVTEGVSSDGCSMATIYTPAIINSEIFERLRSSGYTPSVSFADSSLREGAGMGCVPFNVPLTNRKVTGDFHRPYETQKFSAVQKLPVSDAKTIPGGPGHLPYGNPLKA